MKPNLREEKNFGKMEVNKKAGIPQLFGNEDFCLNLTF